MTKEEKKALHILRLQDTCKADPRVEIMLGGKPYFLEFTNRAVKNVLTKLEVNLLKDNFSIEDLQDPAKLCTLLQIGLSTHHPDITEDALDDLLTARQWPYVMNRLSTSLELFMPDMSDMVEAKVSEVPEGEDPTKKPTPLGSGIGV